MKLAYLVLVVATALVLATGTADAAGTGSISGRVSGASSPVCVLVLDAFGQAVTVAAGDDNGAYTIDQVPSGSWTVEFVPDDGCLGEDQPEAIQYFRGASTPAAATPVSVVSGQTTSRIDATLVAGASIKGTVRDAGLTPLSGICAVLEDTVGRPVLRQPTEPNGDYALTQLPPGRFILQFVADGCAGQTARYASSYYPDAATASGAQVIELRAGQLVGGLDVTLTSLPAGDGGPAGGGSPGGTGESPAPPVVRRPGAPHVAVISLVGVAGRRWTVDLHRRLHLRLRCAAGGPACRVTITVRRPRRVGRRVLGGRRVGSRTLIVRAGHAWTTRVALHGVASGQLWVSVRLRGQRIATTNVLRVRWERRVR